MRERRLFKYVFACLLVLMGVGAGWGETKYAGEFLALGVGARALGMGSAFVAVCDDATAGYWNAAGLSRLESREVLLMHSERFAGIVKNDFLSSAVPMSFGGVGVSLIRLGIEDIPYTNDALLDYGLDGIQGTGDIGEGNGEMDDNERLDYGKVQLENVTYHALYLSYGRLLRPNLSLGTSLKILNVDLITSGASGYGLDIGFLYMPIWGLVFGANLRDVTGTVVSWDTGAKDTIRPSLEIGMAYRVGVPFFKGRFIWAVGSGRLGDDGREAGTEGMNAGLEYQYGDLLALRLGSEREHLTAGAGVCYNRFGIDYAFLGHEALGGTHRVSASVRF